MCFCFKEHNVLGLEMGPLGTALEIPRARAFFRHAPVRIIILRNMKDSCLRGLHSRSGMGSRHFVKTVSENNATYDLIF